MLYSVICIINKYEYLLIPKLFLVLFKALSQSSFRARVLAIYHKSSVKVNVLIFEVKELSIVSFTQELPR